MENLKVAVRHARPADAPRLIELLEAGSLRPGAEDTNDVGPYAAALREIDADPRNTVLVAEVEGEVVGMCQVIFFRHIHSQGGLCAEVESVHVAADWRSRGVGGVLLESAAERARAAGCYRVQLTSNKQRPDAHRFYLRHGFVNSHEGFKRFLD
jgi:GNAT superfamily N-acetyltransferase